MSFSYSEPATRTLRGADLIGFILLLIEGVAGIIIIDWEKILFVNHPTPPDYDMGDANQDI